VVRIPNKENLNKTIPDTTALDEPFSIAHFSRKSSPASIYDGFDLFNRAVVLRCILKIPTIPPEILHTGDDNAGIPRINIKVA
jgi:hypothetical protein